MIRNLLLVGLGGGLGSMARYLCQRWLHNIYPVSFPTGTFVVNISGCFLIGIFWGLTFRSFNENENWKLFMMTGICGGFTTFSSFSLEGIGLLREEKTLLFFLYIGGSLLAGLLATYIGMKLTR
ncbi:MAG TPA: fluoride efflux transporter CrcB [Chitinophagaceae bacterium]|jgi:crcB protein